MTTYQNQYLPNVNRINVYIALVLVTVLFSYLLENFFVTQEVVTDHFINQLSIERIQKLLDFRAKWSWVNHAITPIILLIKFGLISLWILCACVLLGYRISFSQIFGVVIIAEFVWLIPSLLTIIWFGLFQTDYVLLELQYFKPLSLLNMFDATEVQSWLIFPLQALNLFEVVYMFVLAIGMKAILKKDYMDALNFTVGAYGTALITWIVFITFLSINLSAS